jgi:hypothetical protein
MESSITAALGMVPHPPSNKSELDHFLRSHDLDKPNDSRLIAWLLAFDIIPFVPLKWGRALSSHCADYFSVRASLSNQGEPIDDSAIRETVARVINADTSRSILWFTSMARIPFSANSGP